MITVAVPVRSPAERLLWHGLELVEPALRAFGEGALLVGGLATAAWLLARPVGVDPRSTTDVDLGINRGALGISRTRAVVGPALRRAQFTPGYGDEEFRFARETPEGLFVVGCLIARGASRADPPVLEPGITTVAAPGLAYAFKRGPVRLRLVLLGDTPRTFDLYTVTLDSAFVMKAALVASGVRPRRDHRVNDTADAVLLAAACAQDGPASEALRKGASHGEAKVALDWLQSAADSPGSAISRRVAELFQDDEMALWAASAAARLLDRVR